MAIWGKMTKAMWGKMTNVGWDGEEIRHQKLPSYHISGSAVKQALETTKKEAQLMELKKQDRLKKKVETLATKKSKGVPKTPGKWMTTRSTKST